MFIQVITAKAVDDEALRRQLDRFRLNTFPCISLPDSGGGGRTSAMARPPALVLLSWAVVLVLSTTSCRSDARDPAGGATVPTEAPASTGVTTTTTEAAAFAVPDDPARMDVAYANRVMAALKRVQGDLLRKIVATRLFEIEDLLPIRAVFADDSVEAQAKGYADLVGTPDSDWEHPPGDNVVSVARVVTGTRNCLVLEATVDVGPTVAADPPPRHTFILLRPKDAATDPEGLNPTPWALAGEFDEGPPPCD